jgi:hypothetical protein
MTGSDHARSSRRGSVFFSPLFLACALVLLIGGLGMHPGLDALIAHYGKEPIGLRLALDEFDRDALPSFRFIEGISGHDPGAKNDAIDTADWINYSFLMNEPPARGLNRRVGLFVTFYSDPRETIPHTPEVCYRQAGAKVEGIQHLTLDTPALGPDLEQIDATLLDVAGAPQDLAVLYVLCVEGKLFPGRERARWAIALSENRYTYLSKVEAVAVQMPGTRFEDAAEQCRRLLLEALPVLMERHFPRPDDLRR